MPLIDYKIPIIVGRNDIPTTSESDPEHPNGSFVTAKYNDLIDNILDIIRSSISITGNATYNEETGVITVSNADFSVDHISLTNTNGRFKTYTIWADSGETIQLGQFTVADGTNGTNGTNGQDGRNIEKVTAADNGNGTKTITFWGDSGETINLGNVILATGVDGADGQDGADGRGITINKLKAMPEQVLKSPSNVRSS